MSHNQLLSLSQSLYRNAECCDACVQRLNMDGKTTRTEDAVVSVDVGAGWKAGTRITFEGDGHEGVGLVPSDLVFTLRDKPHPRFTRRDNDLVHRTTVTLLEAL